MFNKISNINNDIKSNTNINIVTISNTRLNNIKSLSRNNEIYSNKKSYSINSFYHLTRNRNKNFILCISEKYIKSINGDELKYILIQFFKKFFNNNNEEDKFSFIQFSYNGKKTISIKSQLLEIFLQKLESNKNAFKINNDDFNKNNFNFKFLELFINTSDIRFNGQKECVDTINELNNNNYSVIIFTNDFEINEEKIKGIYSFINGLNDGHFFTVKNYQQIKQVLMNFSVKISQEKFNNYNYEITDNML